VLVPKVTDLACLLGVLGDNALPSSSRQAVIINSITFANLTSNDFGNDRTSDATTPINDTRNRSLRLEALRLDVGLEEDWLIVIFLNYEVIGISASWECPIQISNVGLAVNFSRRGVVRRQIWGQHTLFNNTQERKKSHITTVTCYCLISSTLNFFPGVIICCCRRFLFADNLASPHLTLPCFVPHTHNALSRCTVR
jgi:hypothetical protein